MIRAVSMLLLATTHLLASENSEKEQNARIRRAIAQVVYAGSEVYNKGDHIACVRIYQGALLAIDPMLDRKPELQRAARKGWEEALKLPGVSDRAFALRAVLDTISADASGPLWDRLGGEAAVRAVVHDFVGLLAQNPKVDVSRGGRIKLDAAAVAKIENLLVEQISSVTGGPLKYTGRDMKTSHAGLQITDAQFDAAAADLVTTLKKYRIPQKEVDELIKIIAATRMEIVEKK